MADVFISYHNSEGTSALVRRIADELESIGISCWYDFKDPAPGYFAQAIKREIENCRVFLLIWDEGANSSEWCMTEAYIAFKSNTHPIRIPFRVGNFTKDSDMDIYMMRCQIFNGGDSPENADIRELITKISVLFERTPAKIIKSGPCGLHVSYTLDENGILTIFGNGSMWDYHYIDETKSSDSPWWNERTMISRIKIEYGVTHIGNWSFIDCGNLEKLIISNSVTEIGKFAFCNCICLSTLSIPNSVIRIRVAAFMACCNLKGVDIQNGVTKIEGAVFSDCISLVNVNIPDTITSIGILAFWGCNRLISVSIPESLSELGVGYQPDLVFPNSVQIKVRSHK